MLCVFLWTDENLCKEMRKRKAIFHSIRSSQHFFLFLPISSAFFSSLLSFFFYSIINRTFVGYVFFSELVLSPHNFPHFLFEIIHIYTMMMLFMSFYHLSHIFFFSLSFTLLFTSCLNVYDLLSPLVMIENIHMRYDRHAHFHFQCEDFISFLSHSLSLFSSFYSVYIHRQCGGLSWYATSGDYLRKIFRL